MALKVRPIVAPKRANGQICGEIYSIAVKMAEPSFRTLARFQPRHVSYINARPSSTTVADDLYYQCKLVLI